MGYKRGGRQRRTRRGGRLYALTTANQVRKALRGKPGFVQVSTVERGIVMILHTLHRRTLFPIRLFYTLGSARMARDNWTPNRKPRKPWSSAHIPQEYQAR